MCSKLIFSTSEMKHRTPYHSL